MSSDMTATPITTLRTVSGLGSAAGTPRRLVSREGLYIAEEVGLPVLSLRRSRIDADDAWLPQLLGELGLPMPGQPRQMSGDAQLACTHIEPHRWLLTGVAEPGGLAVKGWLVTDVSAAYGAFRLTGSKAISVLASGGNLHGIEPGMSCRLPFAESVNVVIQRLTDEDFRLMVDVSYAAFLADWLNDAATNHFPHR
jgi:heterotetrameric sarcosine oxidase gamma subunit